MVQSRESRLCYRSWYFISPHGPSVATLCSSSTGPNTLNPSAQLLFNSLQSSFHPRLSPPASLHVEWSFARIVHLASARRPGPRPLQGGTCDAQNICPKPCTFYESAASSSSDVFHWTNDTERALGPESTLEVSIALMLNRCYIDIHLMLSWIGDCFRVHRWWCSRTMIPLGGTRLSGCSKLGSSYCGALTGVSAKH